MKTVLVIEDEPDIVLLVRVALELEGFRVIAAASGEEGLAQLETEDPDLIVLDLRLPGIDGWEVLERLRASGRLPDAPVVIISAHGSPGTSERATAAGCRAFLRKPFHPRDLVRVVSHIAS